MGLVPILLVGWALTLLYQPTAVTPASALRHVVLLPSLLFVVAPTRRHVRGAIIHWTAFVSYPSNEWLQELRDSVAHFLGLSTHEVELRSVSTYRKFAWIVRT